MSNNRFGVVRENVGLVAGQVQINTSGMAPTDPIVSGYRTESMLSGLIRDEGANALQKAAGSLSSKRLNRAINDKLANISTTGINQKALNKAVEAARSAADKIGSVLGGKSSLSSLTSTVSSSGSNLEKTITNTATGAVDRITSAAQDKLSKAVSGALGNTVGGLLGSQLSKLNDTAAKNLAGARLAPGFLENGPDEKLAATDVYGLSDSSILNDLKGGANDLASKAFETIRKSSGGLLTDLVKAKLRGDDRAVSNFKDNLSSRVLNSLGGRSGVLDSLAPGLKNSVMGAFGLSGSDFNSAMVEVGGVLRQVDAQNMDATRAILSLANTLTQTSVAGRVIDIAAESSLLAGVVREAINLGVPDIIDTLIENAKTTEVGDIAMRANMIVAIEKGDLATVQSMVNRMGRENFLTYVPDAVRQISTHYRIPAQLSEEDYPTELSRMLILFDQLDPLWRYTDHGGTSISSLAIFSGLSDDARLLFMTNPSLQLEAAVAAGYGELLDGRMMLKNAYPLAPFNP